MHYLAKEFLAQAHGLGKCGNSGICLQSIEKVRPLKPGESKNGWPRDEIEPLEEQESILHRLQSLRPMQSLGSSPPGLEAHAILRRRRGGAKAMTKGALMKAISSASHVNQKHCRKVLSSLRTLALREVKKTGVFAIPGLCRMKKLDQPARSEHTATILGKIVPVQARAARTVVKASPLRALKKQI